MKTENLILIAGIIIYIGLFAFLPYHINDTDSFYYMSMEKRFASISIINDSENEKPFDIVSIYPIKQEPLKSSLIPSDGTVLGNVINLYGLWWGKFLLFLFCLITAYLIAEMISDTKTAKYIFLFVLYTPMMFFMNGWFGRYDKNILELFLFVMLMKLVGTMFTEPTTDKVLGRPVSFSWRWVFFPLLSVYFLLAKYLWQGWYIFVGIFILYYFLISIYKQSKLDIMISFCFLTTVVTYLALNYVKMFPNKQFIFENTLSIWHLVNVEFVMFVLIFVFSMKLLLKIEEAEFIIMTTITLCCIFFFPRLMLFIIPLLAYLLSLGNNWNYFKWGLLFVILFSFMPFERGYMNYFQHDQLINITSAPDPCGDKDCIIVSDWTYGWVYLNTWKHPVMFKGHPSNITDELDYLYYKNKTCDKCVLVYQPEDKMKFEFYKNKLELR